jgi:hypothetical protein
LLEEKFHDGVMVPVGQTTGTGGGFTRARISRRWWVRSIRPKIKPRAIPGRGCAGGALPERQLGLVLIRHGALRVRQYLCDDRGLLDAGTDDRLVACATSKVKKPSAVSRAGGFLSSLARR